MEIHTIGFAKRSAAEFFNALKAAGIRRLVDIRLNNTSQLAGFTKRDDLAFFLKEICAIDYVYQPLLAPTQELLDGLKKNRGSWEDYEHGFLELMRSRDVEHQLDRAIFEAPAVLLCSEPKPNRCHRRLVAEYLRDKWGDVSILHL